MEFKRAIQYNNETYTIGDIVKIQYCTFMKKIGRIENISDKGITLDMSSKYHSEVELLHMQEIQSIEKFKEDNK